MKTRPPLEVGTPRDTGADCPTCHTRRLYAYPLHALTDGGVLTVGWLLRCGGCDGASPAGSA